MDASAEGKQPLRHDGIRSKTRCDARMALNGSVDDSSQMNGQIVHQEYDGSGWRDGYTDHKGNGVRLGTVGGCWGAVGGLTMGLRGLGNVGA